MCWLVYYEGRWLPEENQSTLVLDLLCRLAVSLMTVVVPGILEFHGLCSSELQLNTFFSSIHTNS